SWLQVERLVGIALFVFGKGDTVVDIVVALRSKVTVARERAPLEVLREQAVVAPDGCVGVVERRHGSGPRIHFDLVADRSIYYDHRSHRAGRAAARADTGGCQSEDHRKILWASACHDGVDRYLFDRKLPKHAKL